MSQTPCPVCGKPIADTAYVCGGCGLTAPQDAAAAILRPDQPDRALPDQTGPDRPSERRA